MFLSKLLIIIALLSVVAVPVHAQAPEDWNFRFKIVDVQGNSWNAGVNGQVPSIMYRVDDPSKVVCRGYCDGYTQKLEPGVYDLVVETAVIKNIRIETGTKVDKVITYQPPVFERWNFDLASVIAESGKEGVWYRIFDANNPRNVYCYCSPYNVPHLLLPDGQYQVDAGLMEKDLLLGIITIGTDDPIYKTATELKQPVSPNIIPSFKNFAFGQIILPFTWFALFVLIVIGCVLTRRGFLNLRINKNKARWQIPVGILILLSSLAVIVVGIWIFVVFAFTFSS